MRRSLGCINHRGWELLEERRDSPCSTKTSSGTSPARRSQSHSWLRLRHSRSCGNRQRSALEPRPGIRDPPPRLSCHRAHSHRSLALAATPPLSPVRWRSQPLLAFGCAMAPQRSSPSHRGFSHCNCNPHLRGRSACILVSTPRACVARSARRVRDARRVPCARSGGRHCPSFSGTRGGSNPVFHVVRDIVGRMAGGTLARAGALGRGTYYSVDAT
jgi:hypothetical protein